VILGELAFSFITGTLLQTTPFFEVDQTQSEANHKYSD
jgi:hypothetical protein